VWTRYLDLLDAAAAAARRLSVWDQLDQPSAEQASDAITTCTIDGRRTCVLRGAWIYATCGRRPIRQRLLRLRTSSEMAMRRERSQLCRPRPRLDRSVGPWRSLHQLRPLALQADSRRRARCCGRPPPCCCCCCCCKRSLARRSTMTAIFLERN